MELPFEVPLDVDSISSILGESTDDYIARRVSSERAMNIVEILGNKYEFNYQFQRNGVWDHRGSSVIRYDGERMRNKMLEHDKLAVNDEWEVYFLVDDGSPVVELFPDESPKGRNTEQPSLHSGCVDDIEWPELQADSNNYAIRGERAY